MGGWGSLLPTKTQGSLGSQTLEAEAREERNVSSITNNQSEATLRDLLHVADVEIILYVVF